MEYGLHSKHHHPHPQYRTKDEAVKNEQLTELIYISTSGVAVTPGQAKSWDHLSGLKSLPNFWHLFSSWTKFCGFLFFSMHSLSFWIQRSLSTGVCLAAKCFLFSFAFRYKGRLHIILPPPRCTYPLASQATFFCPGNLILGLWSHAEVVTWPLQIIYTLTLLWADCHVQLFIHMYMSAACFPWALTAGGVWAIIAYSLSDCSSLAAWRRQKQAQGSHIFWST